MSYVSITSISTTAAGNTATISSGQLLVGFKAGDTLFVAGHEFPLVIQSVSGSSVVLQTNADTTLSNVPALAIQSNVKLRDAVDIIEKNNLRWENHFGNFITWLTTSATTSDMLDSLGNVISVTSIQGINNLLGNAATANDTLTGLEPRITTAETTLTTIEGTLDAKVTAAQTSETNSAASQAAAATSEANAQTFATSASNDATLSSGYKTDAEAAAGNAQSAIDSVGLVNKTMNFLSFSIDVNGDLICSYNGVQDSSAFNINASGELEVTI